MCGRSRITTPAEELARVFGIQGDLPFLAPNVNLKPTEPIPIVRLDANGRRRLAVVRWGLVPSWAPDPKFGSRMFNARSETAATAKAFGEAWKRRRCLVVVDAFYEWAKDAIGERRPNLVRLPDSSPMGLAGLWDTWTDRKTGEVVDSCTVLTRGAEGPVRALHDRMPVVLSRPAVDAWLDPSTVGIAGVLTNPVIELVTEPLVAILDPRGSTESAPVQGKLFD